MADFKLKIALTRQSRDNRDLANALNDVGFKPLDWPAISITVRTPKQEHWEEAISKSSAVAFVSPNAARSFATIWTREQKSLPPVVSQGPGTTTVLIEAGFQVKAESMPSTSEGLANTIIDTMDQQGELAIICGDKSRSELSDRLLAMGRMSTRYVCYNNDAPSNLRRIEQPLAAIVFCSPTAAQRCLDANPWLSGIPAVAIGPLTASYLRHTAKLSNVTMSEKPTVSSLVDAVIACLDKDRL